MAVVPRSSTGENTDLYYSGRDDNNNSRSAAADQT